MKFFLLITLLVSFILGAVDINNADKTELATLKGIGLKKATRIIKYREEHGCFKSFKDFRKVKGVKKKTIKKNKKNLIIGECEEAK